MSKFDKVLERLTESDEESDENVSASIEIEGPPDTVSKILQAIKIAENLGDVGSSRTLKFDIDGDGHERLSIKKCSVDLSSVKYDCDGSTIWVSGKGLFND